MPKAGDRYRRRLIGVTGSKGPVFERDFSPGSWREVAARKAPKKQSEMPSRHGEVTKAVSQMSKRRARTVL